MPKSTKLQKKIISPTVEIPQIEIDEESSSDSETEVVSKIEKPKKLFFRYYIFDREGCPFLIY